MNEPLPFTLPTTAIITNCFRHFLRIIKFRKGKKHRLNLRAGIQLRSRKVTDDTVIYTTGSRPDDVMMKIQEDIQRVEQWMKSNQLVLNLAKTKSLLFGTAQKLAGATDFKILIQGKEIDRVSKFCYLGVTLDENLSWKEHVGEVFKKVNKRLGLLGRIRSCLTIQAAKCIYNCLILPVLSYTDTAWGELSAECSNRLQRLQNRAARITIRCDRSSDAIKNLGWEKLETIRKRNKATLVFKCLNNLAPACFKNYFTRNSSYHFYNTIDKNKIFTFRKQNLAKEIKHLDFQELRYLIDCLIL